MAALSHGMRHLHKLQLQGIGGVLHSSQKFLVSHSRTFFSRLLSSLSPHSPQQPPRLRPSHFSNAQTIHARLSLPVRHALARPFSPPRLPRPPVVPRNVVQVGLGTARAFHSGRPIFQNMVDNVPIATRALWEAEWDLKLKKEARRLRRAAQSKQVANNSRQMLKPKPEPIVAESQSHHPSELDAYFPVEPTSLITTHLLVPLAPTPTARLPLSADTGGAHPLLPISHLAHIHSTHRLHSLRVSTLFARLDSADVWDDPGVNVDAYAFAPRHDPRDKQCTILRVTFRGWTAPRVRAILGDSTGDWYSLQESLSDGHSTLAPLPNLIHEHISIPLRSPLVDSTSSSEVSRDRESDLLSSPPIRATASAQHDLILPTLDFSSTFSDAVHNVPSPPQPVLFLRTASELACDAADPPSLSSLTDVSWERPGLSSSFLNHG